MSQPIAPIQVRPWTLNGISERMLVSHYENDYGSAVRTLNAIRRELSDPDMPAYRLRALKREEARTLTSVELHELYFANLGGEGNKLPDPARAFFEEHFGSVAAWRREFIGLAESPGWVLLTYSRRQKRFWNTTHGAIDAAPLLVLDMHEHAYALDFGANATAYIDAFMRNIEWNVVMARIAAVTADRNLPAEDPSDPNIPSLSIEELAARLDGGETMQVLDARPRHHITRTGELMDGAVWRDPDRIDEWAEELEREKPVAVYCAYGFHVGCNVARALRERGFDARYVRGGVSAWYAGGGARALRPPIEPR
jgi:Fe-Mn family superoxide dismutase